MAAAPDTGGRGYSLSRVGRIDPGAYREGAKPCRPPAQNGGTRHARQLIAAMGDRVVAAPGRERSHSHGGRERHGKMDLAASPRKATPHRAHAEKEDESGTNPGESEGTTGGGRAKTPAPGKGAKREAGYRRPGRAARRETGGDSKAAPESTAAIDPANRSVIRRPGDGHQGDPTASNGTRQPRGARRQGDATTGNRTSQGGAGLQGDTAIAIGTRQPRGARHEGDTTTTSRTSQGDAGYRGDTAARTGRSGGADRRGGTANGAWQPRGARRQGHTADCNRTSQGGTGRHGDTTASRRRGNAAAARTSRPGCAGPAASGTRGTSKISRPAVHQKDPCQTTAKEEGRDDRRISGLYLPATLASKSDPRFEATSHDRRRVALGSPSPLPATATLRQ